MRMALHHVARIIVVLVLAPLAARLLPLLPARYAVVDRFETEKKAPRISVPTLIIHGERDALIPASMGRALGRAFPHASVEVIAQAHHNDLFAPPHGAQVLERLIAFASAPFRQSPGQIAAYGAYLNWLHMSDATLTFPQTLVLRYGRFEPTERQQPQVVVDYTRWFLARLRAVAAAFRPVPPPACWRAAPSP